MATKPNYGWTSVVRRDQCNKCAYDSAGNPLVRRSRGRLGITDIDRSQRNVYAVGVRVLLGMALAVVVGCSAFGAGLTSVEINGEQYSNITKVYVGSHGRIVILIPGGGTSASADSIPANFLASWNIDPNAAKSAETQNAVQELVRAIAAGCFREIGGVVYDTRKPQADWVTVSKAKVIQVLDDGAILDITPDAESYLTVHVKNLAATIGDTDTISFSGKLVGNYSFINKLGDDRTIREYDAGRVCSRDEIPESVLTGKKAFDVTSFAQSPNKDLIASLPESSELKASGSGFFITEDGYLISNHHVVNGATKVRLVTSAGTIDAKVIQVDSANDLALLKAEGKFSALPIAASRGARLGGSVATIGFPNPDLQGFSPKLAKGEIASLSGIQDDPRYFQISVPVQPGNSGGALVDEWGNVIGIVSAKLDASAALATSGALPENVNYAVKSSLLLSFLESVPEVADKLKAPVTAERKFEDVVKSAQDAAVLVLVY
jgi:S1-C subfamily serine protease